MPIPADRDYRFFAPWPATVTNIEDPLGLHRVKCEIRGFVEETEWCLPRTAGGGSPQWGGNIVPPVGSDVIVEFLGGDKIRPVYSGANWGLPGGVSEAPRAVVEAGPEAHLVHALQLGPLVFSVDLRPRDDVAGTGQLFTIRDEEAETDLFVYDLIAKGLEIQADSLVRIAAVGLVDVRGMIAQIQGRQVRRGTTKQV